MTAEQQSPAKWALDLYDHGPPTEDTFAHNYFSYFVCPAAMIIGPMFRNAWLRRPQFAGIRSHIAYGIAGLGLAYLMDRADQSVHLKRDAVMRHYVSLYPERFPEPPNPKFSDVLFEWVPIR